MRCQALLCAQGRRARPGGGPSRVAALLLSDVIGDPIDVIGSGPTAPDASTFVEALAILDRFDLRPRAPASVRNRLERGARGEIPDAKPDDAIFERVTNTVIGNNQLVVDAAASRATALGLAPHVSTRSLHGEARDVARELVALGRDIAAGRGPMAPPVCVIAGGETTVTVRGEGIGGRCQEFALSAALELEGRSDLVVLAAGTDGSDGPTDAAGAIADGDSAARAATRALTRAPTSIAMTRTRSSRRSATSSSRAPPTPISSTSIWSLSARTSKGASTAPPSLPQKSVAPAKAGARTGLARMTRECAYSDRAGDEAGAGGGSSEPFPTRETTTQRPRSGNGFQGDRYGVGGGRRTHPPAPASSPTRRMRDPFASRAGWRPFDRRTAREFPGGRGAERARRGKELLRDAERDRNAVRSSAGSVSGSQEPMRARPWANAG